MSTGTYPHGSFDGTMLLALSILHFRQGSACGGSCRPCQEAVGWFHRKGSHSRSREIRFVIHFMNGIKPGFSHALHADIRQHDIAVFYLMLRMTAVNLHAVAVFNKITFAENGTDNGKSAARDDKFICKLDNNIFSVTSGIKDFN